MEVFRDSRRFPPRREGRAVAVGTFDGVHLGHRRVIGSALELGPRRTACRAAVVTFDPHPLQVLRPDDPPQLLTPTAVKARPDRGARRGRAGRDPVHEEFSRLEAEDFCGDVLGGSSGRGTSASGRTSASGTGHAATRDLLRSRDRSSRPRSCRSSSTRADRSPRRDQGAARARRRRGGRRAARRAVPARGRGVEGDERGRSLGIPTANLTPAPEPAGAGRRDLRRAARSSTRRRSASASGRRSRTTASCSSRRTCSTSRATSTARRCRLAFLERLRDEMRFDSAGRARRADAPRLERAEAASSQCCASFSRRDARPRKPRPR